jgi:hypothetical protein
MRAPLAWLDATVTPALAVLIVVAFWIALDVAVIGVARWMSRFRRFANWLADRLFGAEDCIAGEKQIPFFAWVPMPEGDYLAKVTFRPYTYRRPRWFAARIVRAHVLMQHPIPIPPPVPGDTKQHRRRLTEDQAVYFVMVPNAPNIAAAVLFTREYALKLRAEFVFTNGAVADGRRARALT